jgi:hypothetical protein
MWKAFCAALGHFSGRFPDLDDQVEAAASDTLETMRRRVESTDDIDGNLEVSSTDGPSARRITATAD